MTNLPNDDIKTAGCEKILLDELSGAAATSTEIEKPAALKSSLRCCLCFWLDGVDAVRKGQIAIISRHFLALVASNPGDRPVIGGNFAGQTRASGGEGLLLARSRRVALVDPRPGPRLCQYLHVVPSVALQDAACH